MEVALVTLVIKLVAMLLGGRSLAIVFVSIVFYVLPYFSTIRMSSKKNKTYSFERYPNSEQYNVKILLRDLSLTWKKFKGSFYFIFFLADRRRNPTVLFY